MNVDATVAIQVLGKEEDEKSSELMVKESQQKIWEEKFKKHGEKYGKNQTQKEMVTVSKEQGIKLGKECKVSVQMEYVGLTDTWLGWKVSVGQTKHTAGPVCLGAYF